MDEDEVLVSKEDLKHGFISTQNFVSNKKNQINTKIVMNKGRAANRQKKRKNVTQIII